VNELALSLARCQRPVNLSRTSLLKMANILISQQFIMTGAVFLAAAASFAGLGWKDRRPRESLDPPLIPTTPLMLVAGIIALLALGHLSYILQHPM
jgi:hypothetical protein